MLAAYLALQMAAAVPAPDAAPANAAEPPAAVVLPGDASAAAAPAPAVPVLVPAVAAPAAPADPAMDDVIPRVPGEADPLQPINRIFYAINRPIDRFVIRPAAMTYKTVVPKPLRDGARNFLQLLDEPVVIFNDLLQLRPGRAVRGVARFVVNATLGFGGLFDVAKRKPFHLPHHDNGFGDTLGVYGIGPLLYVYLPVLGPTTMRDFGGDYVDDLVKPRLLYLITHPDSDRPIFRSRGKVGKANTVALVVDGLDERAENDQELQAIEHDSVDPYAAMRTSFLQDRAGEIAGLKAKDGVEAANPHLDDPLLDPAAGK
ncbi:MAG: VacJ family lipoprotein [Sphingomonadales bacterium]|nr:VacJ family lipoprotein [Sphingomonadales bacterium]